MHFYVLSPSLVCHFNRHYERRVLCCKPRITRPLLSLNGGISFSEGSSFEPYLSMGGGGGGQTPGMLLFCELLLLVWKQRASFHSRKWTALPPVMTHNWNTSIHSGGFQWGWPIRTNIYCFANVRESPPLNIIFWSFLPRFDYSSLQTLIPRRPLPPSHPFPSVWLPVSCSLSAFAVVNFKRVVADFLPCLGGINKRSG